VLKSAQVPIASRLVIVLATAKYAVPLNPSIYLLRVSEIIFFLLQKASTRSPFFRTPGDKREEEACGEDIVNRRRRYPPTGLRHGVESRISINAATLLLAFTKANIRGEKKKLSADADDSSRLNRHLDSALFL